jgi:hypothetical protein
MIAAHRNSGVSLNPGRDIAWLDDQVVEMTVFLPQEEARYLEKAARASGLTVGQMVRLIIRDFNKKQEGIDPGA